MLIKSCLLYNNVVNWPIFPRLESTAGSVEVHLAINNADLVADHVGFGIYGIANKMCTNIGSEVDLD